MRSIEVHVIETDDDINLALKSGLLESADLDELYCDECEETVGHEGSAFHEFSVVLYEDDASWFLCADCASPVTERDTILEFTVDFDSFVEGVDGMLEATFHEDSNQEEPNSDTEQK